MDMSRELSSVDRANAYYISFRLNIPSENDLFLVVVEVFLLAALWLFCSWSSGNFLFFIFFLVWSMVVYVCGHFPHCRDGFVFMGLRQFGLCFYASVLDLRLAAWRYVVFFVVRSPIVFGGIASSILRCSWSIEICMFQGVKVCLKSSTG
jgi:hypothetical protein